MTNLVELSGRTKLKLVQLAKDVGKVKTEKLKWPMYWSEKFDGCYCLALKYDGIVTIFSRTGEIYTSMKHIESKISKIMRDEDIIIFEAYEYGTVQSTISGHCRDESKQHPELIAMCHTIIGLDEFIKGGSISYRDGYKCLQYLIETMWPLDFGVIQLIQQIPVNTMELAMFLTEGVWKRSGEGGVLRNPRGFYAGGVIPKLYVGTKRNDDIIKLKQGVSFDLQVIGVYEGSKGTKYVGNLGGLECRWKNGGIINISGMSDVERRLWWDDPSEIIGKIVEVQAMCESSKGLLREPRFKGIRYDKLQGDY